MNEMYRAEGRNRTDENTYRNGYFSLPIKDNCVLFPKPCSSYTRYTEKRRMIEISQTNIKNEVRIRTYDISSTF